MPYPPDIDDASFPETIPPYTPVLAKCKSGTVCSLDSFRLTGYGTSTHGHTGNHGTLNAGGAERYVLAPGSDTVALRWAFTAPQMIRAAKIEIFRYSPGTARDPIWRKWLRWTIGSPADATGTSRFNGDLSDTYQAPASDDAQVTTVAADVNVFPDQYLTVTHAPYKVKMTVTEIDQYSRMTTSSRWFYIDVTVASLTLKLGSSNFVPQPTAALTDRGRNRRNLAVRAALSAQLEDTPNLGEDDLNIDLDGNIFFRTIADAYPTNAATKPDVGFEAWRTIWGTGPLIPIVADIRIHNRAGKEVDSPLALGGARFLWDWAGGVVAPDDLHEDIQTYTRAIFGRHSGGAEWPEGKDNTHTHYGGKRGGGELFLANPPGNQFPYRVAACANRPGAAISTALTAGSGLGATGVVFNPSVIAGDAYKLRVYFVYGNINQWDVVSTFQGLFNAPPDATPHATSGVLTVRRVVKIARFWTRSTDVATDGFDWNRIKSLFSQAGVTVVVPEDVQATPIPRKRWRTAFNTEWANELPLAQLAYASGSQQDGITHGIQVVDFDTFRQNLATHYGTAANPDRQATADLLRRIQEQAPKKSAPRAEPEVHALVAALIAPAFATAINSANNGTLPATIAQTLNTDVDAALAAEVFRAQMATDATNAALLTIQSRYAGNLLNAGDLLIDIRGRLVGNVNTGTNEFVTALNACIGSRCTSFEGPIADDISNHASVDRLANEQSGSDAIGRDVAGMFEAALPARCATWCRDAFNNSLQEWLAERAALRRLALETDDECATRTLGLAAVANADAYKIKCETWCEAFLTRIVRDLMWSLPAARDVDGIQLFHTDFADNFRHASAPAYAEGGPSNRTACTECDANLTGAERLARQCNTCQSILRTNSLVVSRVPFEYFTFTWGKFWSLPSWHDAFKFMFGTHMEGMRAETMIAHEFGHNLFLPHPPLGVEALGLLEPIWTHPYFWQSKFIYTFQSVYWASNLISYVPIRILQRRGWSTKTLAEYLSTVTGPKGGTVPGYHDAADHACIMGYNAMKAGQLHFCGKCSLRLRGWNGRQLQAVPASDAI